MFTGLLQQGECTPWGLWSVSGKRCYEDFVRFGILLGDFVEGSRSWALLFTGYCQEALIL